MSEPNHLYTREYFQLFAAVVLYMSGLSLQVHFGEYVAYLGGGESILGWIMGIGMAGSVAARPWIGDWVDRLGTKPVLLGGALVAGGAALGFRLTGSLTAIAVLQIAATLANAMFFTAVAAHTAYVAPPHRRAESLGSIGTAGFTGMIIGPALGDWIFLRPIPEASRFTVFFLVAAAAHWLAAGLIARLRRPPVPSGAPMARQPFFRSLRAFWPGPILLVGATFTLAQTIPFRFLERFAEAQGIANIRNFFWGYAPAAIALRILGRRVPEVFGRQRTVVMGFLLMAGGFLLLREVRTEGQLIWPAVVLGAGHCFIYPSLIDLGAEAFPLSQRGLGTSIILGACDVGFLAGYICWGELITWQGFALTLQIVFGWTVLVALRYTWSERRTILAMGSPDTQGRRPAGGEGHPRKGSI